MTTHVPVEYITAPKNKKQQLEGTLKFILDDDSYYDVLHTNPKRLDAAAIICFQKQLAGYHASVIRAALIELDSTGKIDYNAPIYLNNEESQWALDI